MNVPPAPYRHDGLRLHAEWVVEEADLHAATRALPGSTLDLVRWPIAFFIAYVGVGLSNAQAGPLFTFGSAAVISAGWIILSLGLRGTNLRRMARLPLEQRTARLSIDGDRLRHEAASGHAGEYPLSELTHVQIGDAGVHLAVRGQVFFVPRRALQGAEEAWRAFAVGIPTRPWPTRLGFTLGVWAFALAVALYGFFQEGPHGPH